MTGSLARLAALALTSVLAGTALAGRRGEPGSTKYKQTWPKPYNATTCLDWRELMDEHQKYVMAADILFTSQKKFKPDVELPSDALVGQFQGQIQGFCLTHPGDDVTTAAFLAWTTDQDVFAPR